MAGGLSDARSSLQGCETEWIDAEEQERTDGFDRMRDRERSDSFDVEAPLPNLGRQASLRAMHHHMSSASRKAGSRRITTLMVADTFNLDDNDISSDSDEEMGALPMKTHRTTIANPRTKRQSVFAPATLKELEAASPGMSSWLASSKGILTQIALISCFLLLDIARPQLYKWAIMILDKSNRPIPGVLTGMKNIVAILLSFSLSIAQDGREGFRNCVPTMATVRLIPISSLSTAANILSIFALERITPGTFKLLMQMGLPTTAFLSFVFVGRRYTSLQLQSLAFALVSASSFFFAKAGEEEGDSQNWKDLMIGGIWTCACFVSTSSSAVLGERFLVRDKRPYNAQKVQMEIAGVPASLVALLLDKSLYDGYPKGIFVGWTWRMWTALGEWVLAGWLTGFIVKHFSALVKRLLQGGAAVITYVFDVILFGAQPKLMTNMTAIMVIQAITLFFTSPAPEVTKSKPTSEPAAQSVQLATKLSPSAKDQS